MYTLLISLVGGILVGGAVTWAYGLVESILPALVVFGAAYFFISRKVGKKMEAEMLQVQGEFQRQRVEQGLQKLFIIKKRFGNWQFFTKSAIDGQIGSIYYMRQDFAKAKPFLERAFVRHWVAKGMLGALHYRKKAYGEMDKVFEQAVRYSGKQGLLWSLWAYCHWRAGHTERALAILLQGKKKLRDADAQLNANLMGLQNEKKMKMRGYKEQWYQFLLETPQELHQMRSGNVRFKG